MLAVAVALTPQTAMAHKSHLAPRTHRTSRTSRTCRTHAPDSHPAHLLEPIAPKSHPSHPSAPIAPEQLMALQFPVPPVPPCRRATPARSRASGNAAPYSRRLGRIDRAVFTRVSGRQRRHADALEHRRKHPGHGGHRRAHRSRGPEARVGANAEQAKQRLSDALIETYATGNRVELRVEHGDSEDAASTSSST